MEVLTSTIAWEAAQAYLEALDLNYIVKSMCAEHYALPRWREEDAVRCSQLYKKFLLLQKKYPEKSLVPTREIDEFWHNHILHTKRYVNDCLNIFGYYLHHEPADPDEDHSELVNDYLVTKQLFLDEFQQAYAIIQAS